MKIKSRPDAIARLMTDHVAMLPEATRLFAAILAAGAPDRAALLTELNTIEQRADDHMAGLLTKIEDTFITPFDREDLLSTAELLDDAIDGLDQTADLLVRFELKKLPQSFIACSADLQEMADLTVVAAQIIKKPKKFRKQWDAVSELENRLDTRHAEIIADVLSGDRDVFEAMKLKDLAESIEHIANLIDHFVVSIARTAIKET